MEKKQRFTPTSILVTITFILMVTVNALANILPIAGITTGEVSDSFPNLFAPAGVTFTIWGVIYLLLGLYTLYQLGLFQNKEPTDKALLTRVGNIFAFSSLINAVWIFCWHYNVIFLSVILMLLILLSLITIHLILRKIPMSRKEWFFIKLPFSIYFGWITVATIANITALLVTLGFSGWGLSEPVWTSTLIIIATLIGMTTGILAKDIPYIATLIWAFAGIFIKHTSVTLFNRAYPVVITTVQVAIALLVATLVIIVVRKRNQAD
ncbi:MAG TPA: tryptophan-rich sensory protein [Sphaerochaeta sp.]|nr:tryptophan-rich sensory protein [Sphaerochaeta sp.]